jgi:hypothetical protein
VADNNPDLVALEKDGKRLPLDQAQDAVEVRALLLERVRHALGPHLNGEQG